MEKWLDDFHQIIEQNISDSTLTIVQMASQMNISPRKLYRKVKEHTGNTPNIYIREIRLARAHELLESGEVRTVKEAVAAVGFLKVSYFYTIFKEKYGYPPGEVLRQNGWK